MSKVWHIYVVANEINGKQYVGIKPQKVRSTIQRIVYTSKGFTASGAGPRRRPFALSSQTLGNSPTF